MTVLCCQHHTPFIKWTKINDNLKQHIVYIVHTDYNTQQSTTFLNRSSKKQKIACIILGIQPNAMKVQWFVFSRQKAILQIWSPGQLLSINVILCCQPIHPVICKMRLLAQVLFAIEIKRDPFLWGLWILGSLGYARVRRVQEFNIWRTKMAMNIMTFSTPSTKKKDLHSCLELGEEVAADFTQKLFALLSNLTPILFFYTMPWKVRT